MASPVSDIRFNEDTGAISFTYDLAALDDPYYEYRDQPNLYWYFHWLDRMEKRFPKTLCLCALSEGHFIHMGEPNNYEGDLPDEAVESAKDWEANPSHIRLNCSSHYGCRKCSGHKRPTARRPEAAGEVCGQ